MARNFEVWASTKEIIEDWLLDYTYSCALAEFGTSGKVDRTFNRDVLQGLMELVNQRVGSSTEGYTPQVMKLLVLCNISDGEEPTLDEEEKTELERILEDENMLFAIFGDSQPVRLWMTNLKCQAVFVCCRVGDFKTAKRVYKRVWTKNCTSSVKARVREAMEANDPAHPKLGDFPYSKLLKQTHQLMETLEGNRPGHIPHLLQAALQHQRRLSSPDSSGSNCVACQTVPIQEKNGVMDMPDMDGSLTLNKLDAKTLQLSTEQLDKFMDKVKKISKNKEAYLKRMPSFDNFDMMKDEQIARPKPLHQTPLLATRTSTHAASDSTVTRKSFHSSATSYAKTKHSRDKTNRLSAEKTQQSMDNETRSNNKATISHDESAKKCDGKHIKNATDDDKTRSNGKTTNPNANTGAKIEKNNKRQAEAAPHYRHKVCMTSKMNPSSRSVSFSVSSQKKSKRKCDNSESCIQQHKNRDNARATSDPKSNHNNETDTESDIFSFDGESDDEDAEMENVKLVERIGRPCQTAFKHLDLVPKRVLHGRVVQYPYIRSTWTTDEEEKLYVAVRDCGVGKWAYIKKSYKFRHRSNVNLKDKWRCMLKCGTQDLCNKYGPIPD